MIRVPIRCTWMILALGWVVACRSQRTPPGPSEAERLLASGCEKVNGDEPGEALADLDRVILLAPQWAEARRQRAHCRVLFGDLELALRITPAGEADVEWIQESLVQARAAVEERRR